MAKAVIGEHGPSENAKSCALMNHNQGFTLVELIIVVLILGLLTLTFIPRIINAQNDAEKAAVMALMEGFRSASTLINQKWIVDSQPASLNVGGTVITINNEGFAMPVPRSPQGCADIWNAIQSAPPSLSLMQTGIASDGWTVSTFAQSCIFAFQNGSVFDNTVTPYFSYNPISLPEGSPNPTVNAGTIRGFNLN